MIRSINKSSRVYTPNLQRQIVKINHEKVKFMYNRLYDGCHPCERVVDEWVKILKQAMAVNDQRKAQEDSDTYSDIESSHKRRW